MREFGQEHKPTYLNSRFSYTGRSLTISKALWELEDGYELPEQLLNLEHLDKKPECTWIPAMALALGLSKSMPLYNHDLDESL